MGRSPCCSKEEMKRGAWTVIEDKILVGYIKEHGEGQWRNLPKRAGLKRCGKSCRLRWLNYLRPDIKRGNISHDEEQLIIRLHNLLGNRWSLIAGRLPGRTDNEIKNYWNSTLAKKAQAKNTNHPIQTIEPSNSVQPTQVVRTKAIRFPKDIIPFQNQTIIPNPTAIELPPILVSNLSPTFNSDFLNIFQCQDDQELLNYDQNLENYGVELDHHQSLPPSDQEETPWINDWIMSVNYSLDDNNNLDLDSFAYLLQSEQWP